MSLQEQLSIDENTHLFNLRKQKISEYKHKLQPQLSITEMQAIMSAWTRIEDYAIKKQIALSQASMKYLIPKSVIERALKELPIKYTAFENQKDRFRTLVRESKIDEFNYQMKMAEDEPKESFGTTNNKVNEITYKYPVILNKPLLKQKLERPIKKTTLEKFDKSIGKTRLTNIFYGVVGSVTYLEAIEISRVMGLKFSDFVKEVLMDGKQVEIADFIQKGLQQGLSFNECNQMESQEVETEEVAQTEPIDVEQIEMWQDIQESLNVGSLGVYEKRKLSNLIAMQIEKLTGNL